MKSVIILYSGPRHDFQRHNYIHTRIRKKTLYWTQKRSTSKSSFTKSELYLQASKTISKKWEVWYVRSRFLEVDTDGNRLGSKLVCGHCIAKLSMVFPIQTLVEWSKVLFCNETWTSLFHLDPSHRVMRRLGQRYADVYFEEIDYVYLKRQWSLPTPMWKRCEMCACKQCNMLLYIYKCISYSIYLQIIKKSLSKSE